jgi:SPP1 gp7 family putative phage head morphogenesis protein
MPEAAYGGLPFDEAIQYFQNKGYKFSPNSWMDLWQEAHARAFTVARVTAMDVLTDIRKAVDKATVDGVSLGQFKKDLRPLLEKKGWLAPKGEDAEILMPDGTVRKRLAGWRLDTIFRTNLQSAFQTGRYEQMQRVSAVRPYWQYDAVGDKRTRPSHAALDGKVYRSDDSFWDTWYPPNGFNCRCTVNTLSERQVKARGLKVSTGQPKEQPDEGWRYNVGKAGLAAYKPDYGKYTKNEKNVLAASLKEKSKTV